MNENEKEEIELDIEAKYVNKTEKEFLSRVTYAECLYILTPKNKYCDKIKELSVLKLCEIIEKLQKENKELKDKYATFVKMSSEVIANSIPTQKVKDKIEELKINLVNMQGEELLIYESKIDILQELLRESEE